MTSPDVLSPIVETATRPEIVLAFSIVIGAISLTWRQRQAIRERDEFKCQVAEIVPEIRCGGPIEVEHIIAKEFAEEALKLRPQQYNHPNNLIVGCLNHHRMGGPHCDHPDMHKAYEDLKNGEKDAIEKAVAEHRKKAKNGQIYWNNEHDGAKRDKAIERTKLMDQKTGNRRKWWPW